MAKNKLGKFIAFTAAVAAIGGTCYVFRDKIKESVIFQTITGKLANLMGCDDDFTFDDDDAFDDESLLSENTKGSREYTSITITSDKNDSENFDNSDDSEPLEEPVTTADESKDNLAYEETSSPLTNTDRDVEDIVVNPSFPLDSQSGAENPDNTTVEAYENEGLSDVYEDPDSLEEQDKLDF